MIKKFVFTFIALAVLIGGIAAVKKVELTKPPAAAFPPMAVSSAVAEAQEWEAVQHAVGTLRADQGVSVASESAGVVKAIHFESGATVKAGDLLLELDTDVERAALTSAQARAELARLNLDRVRELFVNRTNSKAEVDSAEAAYKQAVAEVDSDKAVIQRKTIHAPFAGRLGIRQVNLGQYIDHAVAIVTLQAVNPILVDFTVPQTALAEVSPGLAVRVETDARPGQVFQGKLTAISPELDASTHAVHVQATLENEGGNLQPGMFVNVDVLATQKTRVVAVPATAVYYQPYGNMIFVVKTAKDAATGQQVQTCEQRLVRLGGSKGDFVAVVSGIAAGEEVVTAGVFKLSNGAALIIDNKNAPKASLNPKPRDS